MASMLEQQESALKDAYSIVRGSVDGDEGARFVIDALDDEHVQLLRLCAAKPIRHDVREA